jgi:hypothetical protein
MCQIKGRQHLSYPMISKEEEKLAVTDLQYNNNNKTNKMFHKGLPAAD